MSNKIIFLAIAIGLLGAMAVYFLVQQTQIQPQKGINIEKAGFQTACTVDTDCKQYVVYNQCRAYYANKNEINLHVVAELEKNKSCDSTLWDPPFGAVYGCVDGHCAEVY